MNAKPRTRLGPRFLPLPILLLSLALALPFSKGADATPAEKALADAPLPRVTRVQGTLELGSPMTVEISGLHAWIASGNSPTRLLPFIGGQPLVGDDPEAINLGNGTVRFHLAITPANRETWQDLLRRPTLRRQVSVSVGPSPDLAFPSDVGGSNEATLVIIPGGWGLAALASLAAIFALLLYLASNTDLLRDSGPAPPLPARRPFSLSRTQMAFWSMLILGGYLVLWLITSDLNTITESLLALLGISAGTALGGALIDNNKSPSPTTPAAPAGANPAPAPVPPPPATPEVSQGFLRDILSDDRGISLHRFQMAIWTSVLGVIFIATAYNTLRMPEFSATLLGLMGISSGTYLGFKLPEHRGPG